MIAGLFVALVVGVVFGGLPIYLMLDYFEKEKKK